MYLKSSVSSDVSGYVTLPIYHHSVEGLCLLNSLNLMYVGSCKPIVSALAKSLIAAT